MNILQITHRLPFPLTDGGKIGIFNFTKYFSVLGHTVHLFAIATLEEKNKDGKPIVLKASRMFGLQTDAQKNIGWGEKTQLGVFLKKKGVKHYRELVGREVQITSVTNSKDEKDYLSFN